jgi:DNA-binding CsgD family transcriptional regulator
MAKPTLKSIQEYAVLCRTPRQFKRLLESVRSLIPYRGIACVLINPVTLRIVHMVDVDYPRRYIAWYLANGMCRKDPIFQEWLRTQKPQVSSEVMQRLRHRFDAEHIKRIEEFHLHHEMQGGIIEQDRAAFFVMILNSDAQVKAHLRTFEQLITPLFRALTNSYRYPMLTDRKKTILLWRAQGKLPRQIAGELEISERTVKLHLEEIRKKLYASDLVSAVWIAGQIGITG